RHLRFLTAPRAVALAFPGAAHFPQFLRRWWTELAVLDGINTTAEVLNRLLDLILVKRKLHDWLPCRQCLSHGTRIRAPDGLPYFERQTRGDDGSLVERLAANSLPDMRVHIQLGLVQVAFGPYIFLLVRLEVVHANQLALTHDVNHPFNHEAAAFWGD